MPRSVEIVILLPSPSSDAANAIKRIGEHFKARPTLIIPSILDGADTSTLEALQIESAELLTFAATPVQLEEAHLQAAIAAAVEYELGRVAIPIHYQNVRDQLQREYGFAGVRDCQVEQILSHSRRITEIRDHVYKSNIRYRDSSARSMIRRWSNLLSSGAFANVYDLPSYCALLRQWFDSAETAPADDVPWSSVPISFEVRADTGALFYRLAAGGVEARHICGAGLEFLSSTSISSLVSAFTEQVDKDVVEQLSRSDEIRRTMRSNPLGSAAIDCLQKYAHLWMDYIKHQNLRGQEQKWRGWYLVPEHGPLTLNKLWELQRILVRMSQIEQSGTVSVDTSEAGIANVVSLLKAGNIKYQQIYSADKKRMLFIRQQKNYLFRLGLITEPATSNLSVTDVGKRWLKITTDAELVSAFREIMEQIRWTWCNMPFFVFAREVARRCGGYIMYRELFNWVIHAYDQSQLDDVVAALKICRRLSDCQQRSVYAYIETKLKSLLNRHMSAAAFGHYRTKIKDLMEAFATTRHFTIKGEGESLKLVLVEAGEDEFLGSN